MSRWQRFRHRGGEAGGSGDTVEFIVWAPILLLLLLLPVAAGRIVAGTGQVEAAARAASLQRTPPAAETGARSAAQDALTASGTSCSALQVTVDVTAAGAGKPGGAVVATVSCTVGVDDLTFPGVPGVDNCDQDRDLPGRRVPGAGMMTALRRRWREFRARGAENGASGFYLVFGVAALLVIGLFIDGGRQVRGMGDAERVAPKPPGRACRCAR